MTDKIPLGIQNNNPGNLRFTKIKWRGQLGENFGYCVFDTAINGIRAMSLDLYHDWLFKSLKTIRQLTEQYAPPSENNTENYARFLSSWMAVPPDAPLEFSHWPLAHKYFRGVIVMECGFRERKQEWFPHETIQRAMIEAGKWNIAA